MDNTQPGATDTIEPPGPPGEDTSRMTTLQRIQHVLHTRATLGPAIVLLLSVIIFSIVADNFLQPSNISLIVQQVMVIGTLAIGQTIIILTAGIDLSVGAIMVLSMIVMAKLSADAGVPGVLALLIGFVVGLLCGLLNGLLVTRVKLPPFIVTLGTLNIFFALNLFYSQSATVRGRDMPALLLWTGNVIEVGGARVTYGAILMLLLFALMAFVLKWTMWGRHVYATGDDREAARLSGIRTDRVLLSVYVVAGLIYAIGAWILIGRISAASPQAGITYNLDTITAVVIGGTSLFGGRGKILGTLLGALIVGVFRNGLQLAGIDELWQNFAVGVLVLVAVAIDQWIRRARA